MRIYLVILFLISINAIYGQREIPDARLQRADTINKLWLSDSNGIRRPVNIQEFINRTNISALIQSDISPDSTNVAVKIDSVALIETSDSTISEFYFFSDTQTWGPYPVKTKDRFLVRGGYDNHVQAGQNGVSIGETFRASETNTMGLAPGTLVIRIF